MDVDCTLPGSMAFRERRRTQFKQGQHGSSDGDGGHIGSRTVPAQKTNRIMYQHYQSETSLQSLTAVALLVASLSVPVESRPSYFNCGPWTAGGSLPSAMGSPTYNEAANNECEIAKKIESIFITVLREAYLSRYCFCKVHTPATAR